MVEKYAELGIDVVKLRFRRERVDDDMDGLKEVARKFPDVKILVDANQAWSYTPPYWSRKKAMKVC
jgi:L-alanine-DL-glutamate epimerase-like enolase superfamily enzyme